MWYLSQDNAKIKPLPCPVTGFPLYLATFLLLTCNFCSAKTVGKRGEEAAHDSTEPWSDLRIAIFVIFFNAVTHQCVTKFVIVSSATC